MSYTKPFTPGSYTRVWNTFTVGSERFMLQNLYWKRLARIKPTFTHVSKMYKTGENEYIFDVKVSNKKINYMLKLLDEKVEILEG